MATGLNNRQMLFVREYLRDNNGKRAAIAAGYSEKSAEVSASRLLRHPQVAAEIAKVAEKAAKKTDITVEKTLRELGIVGFSDISNYVVDTDGAAALGGSCTGEVEVIEPDAGGVLRVRDGVDQSAMRAVSSVKIRRWKGKLGEDHEEVEYRLWPKTDALKTIAQHLGMLVHRIAGEDGGPVQVSAQVVILPPKDGQ